MHRSVLAEPARRRRIGRRRKIRRRRRGKDSVGRDLATRAVNMRDPRGVAPALAGAVVLLVMCATAQQQQQQFRAELFPEQLEQQQLHFKTQLIQQQIQDMQRLRQTAGPEQQVPCQFERSNFPPHELHLANKQSTFVYRLRYF